MLTPAQRHFQKVMAERRGISDERDAESRTAHEQILFRLHMHKSSLSQIQSRQAKAAVKASILPEFQGWIDGTIEGDNRPVMGMTLDRINEYFAFATSALVTGVGVMTVSEKLALAGLLLGIVSAVRLAIHRRRIEQASQRRNDLIEQILHQAETRNLSDRERQLLEQLHGDKPA